MNRIKEWLLSYREKKAERQRMELRSRFKVRERGGSLWLTLDGEAFRRIGPTENAETITAMLNEARVVAITFRSI